MWSSIRRPTAYPTGHRLRVAVSTAYWPMIWPSPEAVAASKSLPPRCHCRCARWPSETRSSSSRRKRATPWAIDTIRPTHSERHVDRDAETGVVDAAYLRRFRRSPRSRSRIGQRQHGPRDLDHRSRPTRCRRAAKRIGRRPCREKNGPSRPRLSPKWFATRKTSTSKHKSRPLKEENWSSNGISKKKSRVVTSDPFSLVQTRHAFYATACRNPSCGCRTVPANIRATKKQEK